MSPPQNLYDEDCMKLSTALRAIWLLYRRGHWGLLESIGFQRRKYERLFVRFDMKHITSENGLLRSEKQVRDFMEAVPGAALAGIALINLYKEIFNEK